MDPQPWSKQYNGVMSLVDKWLRAEEEYLPSSSLRVQVVFSKGHLEHFTKLSTVFQDTNYLLLFSAVISIF